MRTQQENTTREHNDIIQDLKTCLNSNLRKGKAEKVLYYIKELIKNKEQNNIKGFEISKFFLKSLYENKTTTQKRLNLNYILRNINNMVILKNKYFKEIEFKKFKAKARSFNNYLYTSQNNYIKSFNVGKIYTLKKQKAYKFLCFDLNKIKQKQKDYKEMFLRSLNLYPEFVLSYFFKLND